MELINQHQVEDDALSLNSLDTLDDNEEQKTNNSNYITDKHMHESISAKNLRFMSGEPFLTVESCEKNIKHVRSLSDVTECMKSSELGEIFETSHNHSKINNKKIDDSISEESLIQQNKEKDLKSGDFVLSVHFIETGIVCDKGKTFGIYAIQVTRQFDSGSIEQWHIYRRYSDFYDLHSKVKDKVCLRLNKYSFRRLS